MATDRQVAHYEGLARQAQALSAGYDDWLCRDDPAEQPDEMEDAPSLEDAEDAVMQDGYELAFCLANTLIDVPTEPVNVSALCRDGYDEAGKSCAELLAVVINAHKADDIKYAAYELRQRLFDALQPRFVDAHIDMMAKWQAERDRMFGDAGDSGDEL